MATTRAQLIQQVALRMDEVSPEIEADDLVVDGSDGNPLYTLIDGLIEAGTLELFSVAPYWRLKQETFDNPQYEAVGSDREIDDGKGTVSARYMIRLKLPDDFLRVAEINCSEFQRPITEAVPEISEMGKRQHNPFLMGRGARPVGVLSHGVWSGSPCREIDCYSVSTNSVANLVATYIPRPAVISDDESDPVTVEDAVPEVLIPALQWLIAARTFGARGDANHAAICQQNAQNLLV